MSIEVKRVHPRVVRIIQSARELFWKHGFKKVSVEEICARALTSKMTFYRFFPNKLELAKVVFDQVVQEGVDKFRQIMEDESSPEEKIKRMILLKIEGTNDISKEFLLDFYNNPELGLKEYIEKKSSEAWFAIIEDFKQAQRSGLFRDDFKPELLFYFSQKAADIVTDKGLMQVYDNPQELVMDFTNLMMYGIIKRD